jgi:hypothetical protein
MRLTHLRRAVLLPALSVLSFLAAAPAARAGEQVLLEGPVAIKGMSFQSLQFEVPGEWMGAPRLGGRLVVTGGGRGDIECLLLRAADFPDWEKKREVEPLRAWPRGSLIDLATALPGPGRYVLVFSNRFSKLRSKEVRGTVSLVWDEPSAVPPAGADSLRARVSFVALPAAGEPLRLAVDAAASTTFVVLAPPWDEPAGPLGIAIRRPGDAAATPPIGRFDGTIEQAGTVDLHGGGERDVFLVGAARDSSGVRRELLVVCPRQGTIFRLAVPRPAAATGGDAGAGGTERAPERSFLEGIAPAYER